MMFPANIWTKSEESRVKSGVRQERPQILRARAELAIRVAGEQMAEANLAELAKLSDNSIDKLLETTYHGAAGALLLSGQNYKDAWWMPCERFPSVI
jgi:hypothetical protein